MRSLDHLLTFRTDVFDVLIPLLNGRLKLLAQGFKPGLELETVNQGLYSLREDGVASCNSDLSIFRTVKLSNLLGKFVDTRLDVLHLFLYVGFEGSEVFDSLDDLGAISLKAVVELKF